ncbi:MAG: hypothetical protein ACREAN_07600, partial [Nitrosopumilaceae archaeon]
VFISLHSTFFYNSRFFTLLDQDLIKSFNPDFFVTFIDDSYAVWKRIVDKTETHKDFLRSYLRLRDILSWRTVEMLVTDLIAKNLQKKNYVLAVKHPVSTLFRMVFEPQTPFLYASYPISSTRNNAKLIKQINDFRNYLHSKYVVFDPLTIDEKILQIILPKKKKSRSQNGITKLGSDLRWKFPEGFSMVGEDRLKYPIGLRTRELEEVRTDINESVKYRDFRLVSDADMLVAYRPYLGKEAHKGVKSELDFANFSGKPSWMYHPNEDQEADESFGQGAIPYQDLNELYGEIEKFVPSEKRIWGGL